MQFRKILIWKLQGEKKKGNEIYSFPKRSTRIPKFIIIIKSQTKLQKGNKIFLIYQKLNKNSNKLNYREKKRKLIKSLIHIINM